MIFVPVYYNRYLEITPYFERMFWLNLDECIFSKAFRFESYLKEIS